MIMEMLDTVLLVVVGFWCLDSSEYSMMILYYILVNIFWSLANRSELFMNFVKPGIHGWYFYIYYIYAIIISDAPFDQHPLHP